ncbi:MAG: SDR family oxidoreductase [Planctomycetaceae bacterium]|nr:SDR family oxidoreductase [Planctomycetaceae bacterium]
MRCLIIGGDGMLGHQLLRSLAARHEVRCTLRRDAAHYLPYGMFTAANSYFNVDVEAFDRVREVVAGFRPQAVINAAGVIKQRKETTDSRQMLEVNAVFPRRLLKLCGDAGIRLVHLSTDCVFNGRRGGYTEHDPIDAEDVYGLSKYLGEIVDAPAVTLRSSIIGLELSRKASLIEWFLAQRGTIRGFTRAIYTGLTTIEMSRVIELVLTEQRDLCGLWQPASQPIDKFDLLSRLARALGRRDIVIEPDDSFFCDRSLSGAAFGARTGYCAPDWDVMIGELAAQIQQKGIWKHAS